VEGLLTLFCAMNGRGNHYPGRRFGWNLRVSKLLSEQVERFLRDTREMLVPIRSFEGNLRTASANIAEIAAGSKRYR
jgi:hypothetical protein